MNQLRSTTAVCFWRVIIVLFKFKKHATRKCSAEQRMDSEYVDLERHSVKYKGKESSFYALIIFMISS